MAILALSTPAQALLEASRAISQNTVEGANTYRLLDVEERNEESGATSTSVRMNDYARGNERAKVVMKLMEDSELKAKTKEFAPYADRLKNNPYVQKPAKIVGVGAAIWIGQSYTISSSDQFKLVSRVEGRNRLSALDLASPIANGQMRYISGSGFNFGVNRTLPLIDSRAEIRYGLNDHSITTQLSREIVHHLVFLVGASELPGAAVPEENASLSYSLIL